MQAKGGIAERADRLVAVLVVAFFADVFDVIILLDIVLWLLAVASTVTVVQRMVLVRAGSRAVPARAASADGMIEGLTALRRGTVATRTRWAGPPSRECRSRWPGRVRPARSADLAASRQRRTPARRQPRPGRTRCRRERTRRADTAGRCVPTSATGWRPSGCRSGRSDEVVGRVRTINEIPSQGCVRRSAARSSPCRTSPTGTTPEPGRA